MEAMVLAAGMGTRLGELTRDLPKALMPVAGVPILDRVVARLLEAGVDRLIINTHHHSEKIVRHVTGCGSYGLEVLISEEPDTPLETGGALLHARELFRGTEPFFLHNADILTDLPLERMYEEHLVSRPLATLAVMARESARALLFDDQGLLGRIDDSKGIHIQVRPAAGAVRRLAFGGIHVISPEMLTLIQGSGAFSILDPYLRLAGLGFRILPFAADGYRWMDIGKPEQLRQANAWLERSLPLSQ
jgi:N-acetyl-alpha-D-muramate 1-phosphate uridylyltransferase